MRDALSIMDQAIACCGTTLDRRRRFAELVGTVHATVLEKVMSAVARQLAAKRCCALVDESARSKARAPPISPGSWCASCATPLVAKVAGRDSPLLQISSDERARVARIAELFSEEDLTRFLQIMLRTHGDLGYKQEQRFHLELGLLKLVHAQRLLPLEQLLSASGTSRPAEAAQPHRPRARPLSPSRAPGPGVRRRQLPMTRPSRQRLRSSSTAAAEAAVEEPRGGGLPATIASVSGMRRRLRWSHRKSSARVSRSPAKRRSERASPACRRVRRDLAAVRGAMLVALEEASGNAGPPCLE